MRGRRHTFKRFMMSPKRAPSKRKPSGYLNVGVKRGDIRRVSRGFVFSLHDMPVKRIGRGRTETFQGLKILIGPSIAQLADTQEVLPETIDKAQARMTQQVKYWTLRELGLAR